MKKKMLRGWIPTTVMIAVMLMGTTFANAGVIYSVKSDETQPCKETVDSGVIYSATGVIYSLTGVIYSLTGVIYSLVPTPPVECGK